MQINFESIIAKDSVEFRSKYINILNIMMISYFFTYYSPTFQLLEDHSTKKKKEMDDIVNMNILYIYRFIKNELFSPRVSTSSYVRGLKRCLCFAICLEVYFYQ